MIEESYADSRLGPDLLWRDVRAVRTDALRRALFVDRDGVLIEEKNYLHDPADVRLLSGACELLKACRDLEIPVIEVTNQSGIGRGRFGWRDFAAVEARLENLLAAHGLAIDAVFACPFYENGHGAYRIADHSWRKPNAGMLFEAALLLNLDLSRSMLIGDKVSDIVAAKNAGLRGAIQMLTGHGSIHAEASIAQGSSSFHVAVARDLLEAIPLILKTWEGMPV